INCSFTDNMLQQEREVLRLSRSGNRDDSNCGRAKKERRRSVRGRRSEVVVCPNTTNSPGVIISTQSEEVMKQQMSKRRDLIEYKNMLEAEIGGWDTEMEAAQLRKRKERDCRKENVDRDITIERCALYRDLGLEDPNAIFTSILKRVDDHSKMSAEEAVIEQIDREFKSNQEELQRAKRLINNFREVLGSETDEDLQNELIYWNDLIQTETDNIELLDLLIQELEAQL
ncbi:hypothetical protein PFISCL1PPCAC_6182, partial [Pristionchus fissidentatus]